MRILKMKEFDTLIEIIKAMVNEVERGENKKEEALVQLPTQKN